MDPRILDNHRRAAQERINVASLALAKKAGVDPSLAAALDRYHDRDPQTNALRKLEATADLLEALAEGPKREAPQPDPVTGERPGDIGFKRPEKEPASRALPIERRTDTPESLKPENWKNPKEIRLQETRVPAAPAKADLTPKKAGGSKR